MSRRPPPRNEPRKAVGCHGGASPRRNADCFVHRARAEAANPKDRNSEPEMRKGTKRDEKGQIFGKYKYGCRPKGPCLPCSIR